jgi:hypothetical protein
LLAAVIGKRVIVIHKNAGFWNFGKTVIVISWFFQWGTLILFPMLYKGVLPDQTIAIMWLGSFLFGRYIVNPVGKLISA